MIELRPVLETDADVLFPYVFRTAVTDTLIWDGPESIEEYQEALRLREERTKAREELIYTMLDGTGAEVGSIGLHPDFTNRSGTVGLWIGTPFQGMGYGSEALRQIVEMAFGEMRLERLEARIYKGNVASRRIFEKNGFLLEGTLRRVALKRGVFLDEWVMGAIREESGIPLMR